MTWFKCSSSGNSMPSDLACGEVTLSEASSAITFPYDTTKTPITVYVWMKDHNTFSSASKGFGYTAVMTLGGGWSKSSAYTNGNGEQSFSGSYGSMTIDSTSGTIEVTNRYNFPVATYDYIIQYATT